MTKIKKTIEIGDMDGTLEFGYFVSEWPGCCVIRMPIHNHVSYPLDLSSCNVDQVVTSCTFDRDQMIELKQMVDQFLKDTEES